MSYVVHTGHGRTVVMESRPKGSLLPTRIRPLGNLPVQETREERRERDAEAFFKSIVRSKGAQRARQSRTTKKRLAAKHGWECFYCGCGLSVETGTVDHVIPLSRGGTNRIDNKVLACLPCNSAKADALPEEWIAARSQQPEAAQ